MDEINAFLLESDLLIYLVVFDAKAAMPGAGIAPGLEAYIDHNYAERKQDKEYGSASFSAAGGVSERLHMPRCCECKEKVPYIDFENRHESKLEERMKHISDTFSQYLMYLIREKKMENAEVWKRAIVDKKVFSKIKKNVDYHPQKLTALCLCVGAKLNLDETKDLLARAGYALSPCDKTDIIFSYFIENEIYDMIELDIQLEEHGLPCIIS